jgi:hypothetical protein
LPVLASTLPTRDSQHRVCPSMKHRVSTSRDTVTRPTLPSIGSEEWCFYPFTLDIEVCCLLS